MTCSFSSFRRIDTLISELVESSIDNFPLKHICKLVHDLTDFFNESDFHDMEITVGMDEDATIFKAHSVILKVRSSYFKTALSTSWIKRSDDGIILFEKKNISPIVFKVILEYMYTGIIDINELEPVEILGLLIACDELAFNELLEDLQIYLIKREEKWVRRNLARLYKITLRHKSFTSFSKYFRKLINQNPELFLKSQDLENLEKSMLIFILKIDNLLLKEVVIWDCVLRWGIGQIEDLDITNVSEWDGGDFEMLREELVDILPLVRFAQISADDFNKKIKPYEKVFVKELFQYHNHTININSSNNDDLQPSLSLQQQQQGPRIGKLMDPELNFIFSSWIDNKKIGYYNKNNMPYEFQLIHCGNRDGCTNSDFEENCYNIEKTIVIMKIEKSGVLIGGYNPVCWNLKEKSPEELYYIETDKSFIFKIDKDRWYKAILSRVKNPKAYENDLYLENYYSNVHLLEDFEVYKVVKKN